MMQARKNLIAPVIARRLLLSFSFLFLVSCRLLITTDETGHIVSGSGSADCAQAVCVIPISDTYTETFTAVATQGYRFVKWGGICAQAVTNVCEIKLATLPEAYSELDEDVDLKAEFESSAFKRAWYRDSDADNYGTPHTSIMAFEQPDGFVINKDDCDDFRDSVSPRAAELQDWLDNDCDGSVDERDTYYRDVDGDFFGSSDAAVELFRPVSGYVLLNGDCNDDDSNIFPFAKETLDSVDNDCDGSVDEGFSESIVLPSSSLVKPSAIGSLPVSAIDIAEGTRFATVTGEGSVTIGPLPVSATDLAEGTRFASVAGEGLVCSAAMPCSAHVAIEGARAGDVVFLRGGTYRLDRHLLLAAEGQPNQLITVESYPGELAVFDGSNHAYLTNIRLNITGSYYAFRRIEILAMPFDAGLTIIGHHNLIEGVHSHHNIGAGIRVGNGGSFNVLRSCTVNDNSGVGIFDERSANGGNSDGIMIDTGDYNRVEHCAAYRNSDDGIDTWKSTNTYVGYSIAAHNGLGDGDGNGFKAGGKPPSRATLVEHSLAYQNTVDGFDSNTGVDVRFRYNTAWGNGRAGYSTYASTETTVCIASGNGKPAISKGSFEDNSWQRSGTVSFESLDPNSETFLIPTSGSAMGDIGAFAQ
jgi:hypothetical protein